jgi:hypothetical protein
MSHISSIAGAMFDVFTLNKALKELELTYKQGGTIHSSCGDSEEVAFVIDNEQGGKLGIRQKKDKSFDFVMEDEDVKVNKEIVSKIKQKYNYMKVMDELKKKGYNLETEEVAADKSLRLKFTKWG